MQPVPFLWFRNSSVSHVAAVHDAVLLRSVSLYGHSIWCPLSYLWTPGLFSLSAAMTKAAMNILYKSFGGLMFSFLLGTYLRMERWVIG